jgi:hypothetical protein
MCEFISWIEYEKKNYFLTDKDLESKEGKSLIKFLGNDFQEDIKGHGAIRTYYNGGNQELGKKLQWGKEKENTDLSSPDNFPSEIVTAIKEGLMSRIGMSLDLLNDEGKRKYNKIKDPAWAEYNKIKDPAWAECIKINDQALAEYKKINDQALAEYNKIKDPAWAEYNKIKDQAWAECIKINDQAWAEYTKITYPALAEYNKITYPALAEYNKITYPAWAEYTKITYQAFWKIFSQKKYRNPLWI